jgi:hypothetical protein
MPCQASQPSLLLPTPAWLPGILTLAHVSGSNVCLVHVHASYRRMRLAAYIAGQLLRAMIRRDILQQNTFGPCASETWRPQLGLDSIENFLSMPGFTCRESGLNGAIHSVVMPACLLGSPANAACMLGLICNSPGRACGGPRPHNTWARNTVLYSDQVCIIAAGGASFRRTCAPQQKNAASTTQESRILLQLASCFQTASVCRRIVQANLAGTPHQ